MTATAPGDFCPTQTFGGDVDVLLVGGGNSAAQIAADLTSRRRGATVWVTQRPPRFLPDDVDGRKLFELATRRVRAPATGEQESGPGGLGDIVMVPAVLTARRRGDLGAQPMFDRLTPTDVVWDHPPGSWLWTRSSGAPGSGPTCGT